MNRSGYVVFRYLGFDYFSLSILLKFWHFKHNGRKPFDRAHLQIDSQNVTNSYFEMTILEKIKFSDLGK